MYVAFLIYSLSGIISKLASMHTFLSLYYNLCFIGIICVLGIYAFLWQQVLKKIPLSVAMSNKPIVLVLGILWAVLIFDEKITWKLFVGIILILCGILIIGVGQINDEE